MVRIITDSTSDILPEEAEALGVTVVPLKVIFKDRTYRDTIDLSHEEFYHLLKTADPLPTTSQPTPADFQALFEDAKQAGDSVVCLLLAASLSGTVQSAQIARDLCGYPEVYVVDTAQAIIGIRMLVHLALSMRSEGASAAQIAAAVEEMCIRDSIGHDPDLRRGKCLLIADRLDLPDGALLHFIGIAKGSITGPPDLDHRAPSCCKGEASQMRRAPPLVILDSISYAAMDW